jgi:hypothetical protein
MNMLVIFRVAFRRSRATRSLCADDAGNHHRCLGQVITPWSASVRGAQASIQEQIASVGTNLLFVGRAR